MSRLNLRKKQRISYYEVEEPNLDEYVFCSKCKDFVYEYCSIHGALLVIPDNKVPKKINFPSFVPRAALTIPDVFLHLAPSTIPGAGLGVFTTLTLPSNVRFGPYRGKITHNADSDYCWQGVFGLIQLKEFKCFFSAHVSNFNKSKIYDKNNKPSHMVDGSEANNSNWMRYVNCSRHWGEQNMVAFQYQGQIYYRTIRIVPRFTELMVFYGIEFAKKLCIDVKRYIKPITPAKIVKPPSDTNCYVEKDTNNKNNEENTEKNYSSKKVNEEIKTGSKITLKTDTNKISSSKKIKYNKIDDLIKNNVEKNTEEIKLNKACSRKKVKYSKVDAEKEHKKKSNSGENVKYNKNGRNSSINVKYTDISDKNPNSRAIVYNNNTLDCAKCENKDQEHLKTFHVSTGLETFSCDICSYKCSNKTLLSKHRQFHNSICCKTCNKYLASKQELENHMCNNTLNGRCIVKKHIRTNTDKRPFTCDICDKKFTLKCNLKIHIRTHTGERPFTCDICDKKFISKNHLNIHIRTHTGEQPFTCDICDKKFTQKHHLDYHIRTHTGEQPFTCDICDKKFTQKCNLNIHIRTHTGERPFTCDICDKKFIRKPDLNIHIRTHTGERPFTCDICDKKFIRKSDLNIHIRTHTGERPFTCDICDKKFIRKSDLNIHIRTHTGERSFD